LLLADNLAARHAVESHAKGFTAEDSAYLAGLYRRLAATVPSFTYVDRSGRERWSSMQLPSLDMSGAAARLGAVVPTIHLSFPIHDDAGQLVGHLEARVGVDAFVSRDSGKIGVPGAALTVRDVSTGMILGGSDRLHAFDHEGEIRSGDSTWMVVRGSVKEPPLDLALSAPTSSYVTPFAAAARAGFVAVLLVALVALLLSAYLTTRLTRPLVTLASAASGVSRGDLEQHVDVSGPREIETLAASFNTMTASVRHAMSELGRRSALAAVGEFSASLAHQVRNALTSIKVDLQRAEERLGNESASQELVSRSLSAVTHLDSAVTGALRIGRSGSITPAPLDLGPVLQAAARRTTPMFSTSGSTLDVAVPSSDALRVSGDPVALEELFVNLLANAAQSLDSRGTTRLSAQCENGSVVVLVTDSGRGIAAEQIDKVLEPFYTTRIGGTGLGLPIARQLAVAHGGELAIESSIGVGTTVTVRLPRV
jgi:signal transduction histidine kinase